VLAVAAMNAPARPTAQPGGKVWGVGAKHGGQLVAHARLAGAETGENACGDALGRDERKQQVLGAR
jgi:hypothetical protein